MVTALRADVVHHSASELGSAVVTRLIVLQLGPDAVNLRRMSHRRARRTLTLPDMAGSRGSSSRSTRQSGRTRPPTQVVAQSRPWGLIAAAIAVSLFAIAVIGYAVTRSGREAAESVTAAHQIAGIAVYDYPGGLHTAQPVAYEQSPPVGGQHDLEWADCTGTVYDAPIRDENAVHALEHGAVWLTYNPDISSDDLRALKQLTDGQAGTMLSPYPNLDAPISLQSWGHQLKVDSVDDVRVEQFIEFLRFNPALSPEAGASCEAPAFIDAPLTPGDPSRTG